MAERPTYQAVVGINFDGLKPPVRVESGGPVPAKASATDIAWLLEQGLIKEVKIRNTESEGEA